MDRREFLWSTSTVALLAKHKAWSKRSGGSGRTVTVGDDRIRVVLTWGADGLKESQYKVGQVELENVASVPWVAEIDGKELAPQGGSVRLTTSDGTQVARSADFEGEVDGFTWKLRYEVTVPGCITKSLTLTPGKESVLGRVSLWNARSDHEPLVARTPIQDIATFYRQGTSGLFVSLDFPYSKISSDKGITQVLYPPHEPLSTGQAYACHPLTIGAVRLLGRERYGYDVGEIATMDSYIQGRYAPRFERPMFVYCGIVNRYVQVENDIIFYTWKDNPTLCFNIDLLKEELKLMPKVGIEYYLAMPGVFDWAPDDPSPELMHALMSLARENGLRMGDYSGCNYLFCPHYNDYRNRLDRPEWLMVDKEGKPKSVPWGSGPFCFGDRDFIDLYINTVVLNCRRYGFEIHCLDFLTLEPCFATNHGHPPGPESLYHQTTGLVRLLEAINAVSPQMMTWSNSGSWADLLPKLAWTNPNLYLTDPYITNPWQGINMTRLLDDARREQMVSLHNSRFIPYRFFTNCQYFFSMNSVVPDIRNFEFGALSTLAVTPNLSLGEVRTWIDRLSTADGERVIQFYQRWTDFMRRNFDLWKTTFQVGDNPGLGGVEIYGHAASDRGFIFVVNPNYWDHSVELPLDSTLGFTASGQCEIAEIYPVQRLRLTAQGPFANFGSRLPLHIPAQQVLVLEVRPAPQKIAAPRMYGLPGTVSASDKGYLIKTSGPQGRTERAAIMLPPESEKITMARVLDVPKQPKRQWYPTPVELLAGNDQGALMEVTFRRAPAPTELREWKVQRGELAAGVEAKWPASFPDGTPIRFPLFVDVEISGIELPLTDERADQLGLGPLANFCGAYIDNAFSESQQTWIELQTGGPGLPKGSLATAEALPARRPLHSLAKNAEKSWWLQTSLAFPFIYSLGAEPFFDEHTILVLPLLRHKQVKEIKAWVNGSPLEVQRFDYPRNRKLACYYADLIGSAAKGASKGAENTLVCHLQY